MTKRNLVRRPPGIKFARLKAMPWKYNTERNALAKLLKKENITKTEARAVLQGNLVYTGGHFEFPFDVGDILYNVKKPGLRVIVCTKPKTRQLSSYGILHAVWKVRVVNMRNGGVKYAIKTYRWMDLRNVRKMEASQEDVGQENVDSTTSL